MNVIAVFGAPRSGTSWLGQIFNSSPLVGYRFQPLFSYAFKSRLHETSSRAEISKFNEDLLRTDDDFVLQRKNLSGNLGVNFFKKDITHLVWKEVRYHYLIERIVTHSQTRIIGIVRHPCGVINSCIKAPKEFDMGWDPLGEWMFAEKKNQNRKEEYYGYAKWKELAFQYRDLASRYPDQFRLITYEQLNSETLTVARSLFQFVELPFERETIDFITHSKSTPSSDPYGVLRLGQVNDKWEEELQKEIKHSILSDPDYRILCRMYGWDDREYM